MGLILRDGWIEGVEKEQPTRSISCVGQDYLASAVVSIFLLTEEERSNGRGLSLLQFSVKFESSKGPTRGLSTLNAGSVFVGFFSLTYVTYVR